MDIDAFIKIATPTFIVGIVFIILSIFLKRRKPSILQTVKITTDGGGIEDYLKKGWGKIKPLLEDIDIIHIVGVLLILVLIVILPFLHIFNILPSPNFKTVIWPLMDKVNFISPYKETIWKIILLLLCGTVFMISYQLSLGGVVFFTIVEIVVLFFIIQPILSITTKAIGPERKQYLLKYCDNPIFAFFNPECRIIKGIEEKERIEPEKVVPVEGGIRLSLGIGEESEIPEVIFCGSNYTLPATVFNDFGEEIPVQVNGILQEGIDGYEFEVESKECGIDSGKWCTVPGKDKMSFVIQFVPGKINISGNKCVIGFQETLSKECGKDKDCPPGSKCIAIQEDCKCVNWLNATCNPYAFFYPGLKVRFSGFFASTENFVVTNGGKPKVETKVGFTQDELQINPIFFPPVYDLKYYKDKPHFFLKIKNMGKGTLSIKSLTLRVAKKDKFWLDRCENLDVSSSEDKYFVYYNLKGFREYKSGVDIICYFKRPDYKLAPGDYRIINLDVMMNYTYTKKRIDTWSYVSVLK